MLHASLAHHRDSHLLWTLWQLFDQSAENISFSLTDGNAPRLGGRSSDGKNSPTFCLFYCLIPPPRAAAGALMSVLPTPDACPDPRQRFVRPYGVIRQVRKGGSNAPRMLYYTYLYNTHGRHKKQPTAHSPRSVQHKPGSRARHSQLLTLTSPSPESKRLHVLHFAAPCHS